jgi:hypothetical protein
LIPILLPDLLRGSAIGIPISSISLFTLYTIYNGPSGVAATLMIITILLGYICIAISDWVENIQKEDRCQKTLSNSSSVNSSKGKLS